MVTHSKWYVSNPSFSSIFPPSGRVSGATREQAKWGFLLWSLCSLCTTNYTLTNTVAVPNAPPYTAQSRGFWTILQEPSNQSCFCQPLDLQSSKKKSPLRC